MATGAVNLFRDSKTCKKTLLPCTQPSCRHFQSKSSHFGVSVSKRSVFAVVFAVVFAGQSLFYAVQPNLLFYSFALCAILFKRQAKMVVPPKASVYLSSKRSAAEGTSESPSFTYRRAPVRSFIPDLLLLDHVCDHVHTASVYFCTFPSHVVHIYIFIQLSVFIAWFIELCAYGWDIPPLGTLETTTFCLPDQTEQSCSDFLYILYIILIAEEMQLFVIDPIFLSQWIIEATNLIEGHFLLLRALQLSPK